MLVTEEMFEAALADRLGDSWKRGLKAFRNCGENLAYDVTNVLLHAADQGPEQVEETLLRLEAHYAEHLQYQHPEIRGKVSEGGENPTEQYFVRICLEVLHLDPHPE